MSYTYTVTYRMYNLIHTQIVIAQTQNDAVLSILKPFPTEVSIISVRCHLVPSKACPVIYVDFKLKKVIERKVA